MGGRGEWEGVCFVDSVDGREVWLDCRRLWGRVRSGGKIEGFLFWCICIMSASGVTAQHSIAQYSERAHNEHPFRADFSVSRSCR